MILPLLAAATWFASLVCWLIGVSKPSPALVKVSMALVFIWMLLIMLTWRVVL